MLRPFLARPTTIIAILFIQLIPLLLFPPTSYSLKTQEWWLPVLLVVFTLIGVFQLVFRRSAAQWPWYLVSFAQGFNIISRLMMLMPHATYNVSGKQEFNTLYVSLTICSMLFSGFLLWYTELPEVRLGLLKD
jgi:hypothetical protein